MKHMHRPDPKRSPEMQDKRMVVILPEGLYEAWLDAPAANSKDFMLQCPADRLCATPESPPPKKGETPPLPAVFEKHGDEDPAVVARRPYPEAGEYFDDLYPAYARRPPNPALFIKPDDVPF